ncbi:MAG: hypothetical protein IPJ84_21095 [Bdellovibrionales bacterium]|jgi:acyl dehydratase|nr:hypothetical protein [Bdellovibrionales bacterium]
MSKQAVVKKVKPYPFPAQVKLETTALAGSVTKMTQQGLLVEVHGSSLQPGEKVELQFVTPVLHGAVTTAAVVVKVTSQLKGISLLELHFRSQTPEHMARINDFLIHTGQVRRS